jgi:hypothetical protein
MVEDHFESIPAGQREAARAAVAAAFASAPIGAITPLSGGVSGASLFMIVAGDRRYVLRIEGPASPLRNPHQYLSMRIAADAGIAPRVHSIDENAGVAVIDFIAERPLKTFPGGPNALAQALGGMLRRLQATPPFPSFVEYPDIVARLWTHVCRTNLFAPGVLDPSTQRLAEISKAYVWKPEQSVSSHNDLLPPQPVVRRRAFVAGRLGVGLSQRSPRRYGDPAGQFRAVTGTGGGVVAGMAARPAGS